MYRFLWKIMQNKYYDRLQGHSFYINKTTKKLYIIHFLDYILFTIKENKKKKLKNLLQGLYMYTYLEKMTNALRKK